ncbi:hypothetical protein P691DRAFT_720652 [Macrolepiota fuliginosa MF-IS2]|uniref:Uncharacterized protein n=1 Tax=Macrolepiota fuliginosa MF-IS2 TaxID=1400762 RepID=A0A9P5XM23_9AGAR|nr:hypothetical protein P691DRAFT_720652 [Macrolepiota fuliginosa MF-IS2]
MESVTNSSILPNPDTYLNHLSPTDAKVFEICRNITLVAFGATIWDILIYIPEDIRIMRRSSFCPVIFCFVFSRLFALGCVLCSVVERTTPIQNLYALSVVGGCLSALSVSCSGFLFLRRVHAVYANSQVIQWTFSAFWVIFAGSTATVPFGTVPTALVSLLYDSCVFLAISYKIASQHGSPDERVGWATLVSGKALPRLSRAVLQGGQQYYLITVAATILASLSLFLPFFPPSLGSIFTIPVVPLVASMACRVFRNIKLFDTSTTTTGLLSSVEFVQTHSPQLQSYPTPFSGPTLS